MVAMRHAHWRREASSVTFVTFARRSAAGQLPHALRLENTKTASDGWEKFQAAFLGFIADEGS
jgi:hypothetical protein